MLEVNAIYFILLLEGFVLLLILLLIGVLIALIRKRRHGRKIAQLKSMVKNRSLLHGEKTRSFLQVAYDLDGEELSAALEYINKHETEFFQHLVDSLYQGDHAQLSTFEAALDELIESYKCLQTHSKAIPPEQMEVARELVSLRGENEVLRDQLSVARNKLSDTIAEFGDMFGGGKDHQLALHEVVERIDAIKADHASEEALKAQK